MVLQFIRSFLGADFALAGKSAPRKLRRERHFMSKRSCEAAESIEDAILRMARVNCDERVSGGGEFMEQGKRKKR